MGFYYPDDYGPYQSTVVPEAAPRRSMLRQAVGRLFDARAELLPPLTPGRLLEVGCASGAFLHRMAARGWTVEGIEFSPTASAAARQRGLRVHTGAIEAMAGPDAPPDLVVAWMVLEHLHDPVRALQLLHRWSRPGAWLVLSVPNVASLEARLFGSAWYDLHLPMHLQHFSAQSLSRMLERCGWHVARCIGQRTLNGALMSASYAANDAGLNTIATALERVSRIPRLPVALHGAATLVSAVGQASRLTVWAQK